MSSSTSSSKPALWRTLALPVVLATVLFGSLRLLEAVYARPNWASMAVATLGKQTQVLAMGSSRVFFGIDPRTMGKPASNLTVNYLDAVSMRDLWHRHAPRLPGVKTVILELDVVNVKFETLRMNAAGLKDLGIDITPGPRDFLFSFDAAIRRVLLPVFRWRLTPDFYRRTFNPPEGSLEPTAEVPGYIPSRVRMAYPEDFARRRVAFFKGEMAAFADDVVVTNIEAYRQLIKALNDAGKRVVLLRFPVYVPVYHLYPQEWVAEIDRTLAALRADPTLTFEFWDEHAYGGLSAEQFRDPEHLNAAGAAVFTRLVAERLN